MHATLAANAQAFLLPRFGHAPRFSDLYSLRFGALRGAVPAHFILKLTFPFFDALAVNSPMTIPFDRH